MSGSKLPLIFSTKNQSRASGFKKAHTVRFFVSLRHSWNFFLEFIFERRGSKPSASCPQHVLRIPSYSRPKINRELRGSKKLTQFAFLYPYDIPGIFSSSLYSSEGAQKSSHGSIFVSPHLLQKFIPRGKRDADKFLQKRAALRSPFFMPTLEIGKKTSFLPDPSLRH